jgi:Fe-S oxidoreductase
MATVTDDVVEADTGDKRGIRPNHMIIGLWTGVAVITAVSGIAAAVFEFHHEEGAVTREVFGNIPAPIKAMFYALIPTLLIYVGFQLSFRVKNWQRGAPENRKTTKKNVKQRLADMRAGLYMQTLMRDPIAGIMHSMIYFGFLILMAVTTTLEIDHQLPESLKFLDGGVYKGYALVGDAAGLMFFAGLMWALSRRLGPRSMQPYRIRIKNKPEHFVILGTLLAISISGFGAEAFRIALEQSVAEPGALDYEKWSFIGYPLAQLVDGMGNLSGWHQAWWIAHVISFALFLIILPTTMLRHMVTSPANMYLKDRDRPKGAMKPMANLMDTEMESFGAAVIEDFTWKQLMDTDSCTMCGRCTDVCPANATGKSLDPREIVLKTGEVMARSGTPQVTPPIGVDKEIALANEPGNILVAPNNVFDRITSEEIWACTTCKACDEACPVNIEILDKILDMRRYLSLMESDFPTELGNAYRAMENQGNPWGMGQSERADWASDFEGLEVLDGGDPMTAEYLYWVGCAGSFDDKNKKVSQAFSNLMDRAGVSFAILGPSEMCTGDPARRSGNEYIFQMLAMQNIETLNTMGVKKIVAQCPHCFNTLANEYPQLGGHYEVVHHSQLLENLIDEGKLDVSNATLEDRLVYHDSCYLGRHNDVYLSPRNVVGSIGGIEVVEAERNGTKGMCCGAGGARMWMEEHVGKQINVERSQELLATGATRIATACPFCYVMIDDGIKGEGIEDGEVLVQDIAMHLLDAIEEGEAKAHATMVNITLKPTSERVTTDNIELPLGFGMHGDLDGDGIKDTNAEPGPIAALVDNTKNAIVADATDEAE